MSLGRIFSLRHFSTSRTLLRPALSANYKSPDLWNQRFKCAFLTDSNIIKSMNTNILADSELSNLEVDVFVNIAAPKTDEIAQLKEAATILKKFRRTLHAHRLLPSTHHALCRLFLDSERLQSLVSLLEKRIEYGIFPDPFCLNLIFDTALEHGNYTLASRAAALIMLQEDFGLNQISDQFALYSVAKYIESKTDFTDWTTSLDSTADPIFSDAPLESEELSRKREEEKKIEEKKQQEEDEDEEDAEYIRIPFLRNPYFDNHFDLKNPRVISGRILTVLGHQLTEQNNNPNLAIACKLVGNILEGSWEDASEALNKYVQSNQPSSAIRDLCNYYITNLHEIEGPSDDLKNSLMNCISNLREGGESFSEQAETLLPNFSQIENQDVKQLENDLIEWSKIRQAVQKEKEISISRQKLMEGIRAKKEELKAREQYLYFYDNLKKSNLTRIEYN